jgi:hypothetical protein
MVELNAFAVFGFDGTLSASGAMAAIADVLFVAVQDRHVESQVQRKRLVALQPGVDLV